MKYLKMFILLVSIVTLVFAGTASATTITSSTGETPTIHATAGELTLHGVATITCQGSTFSGTISSHGSGVTASGSISALTFTACGEIHMTVLTNGTGTSGTGTLELHEGTGSNHESTLTSNGTRITMRITSLGISCIFETSNTHLGTITEGEHAVLDIESANIPRVSGDSGIFCGSNGVWTGSYSITHPTDLTVH